MSKMYYERPDEFIPERWLRGHGDLSTNRPNLYTFGFGKRMCIGKRFAIREILTLSVVILQKYRIEYHHEPIITVNGMNNHPNHPFRFRLIER